MMIKRTIRTYYLTILLFIVFLAGCEKSNEGLAPYEGERNMSNIQVQQGSYRPKITWVGGYASVLGVNRGTSAALDSSLIWLVHINGNNIHYPVTFATLPEGSEDITTQYGGTKLDSLDEDFTYTYWVVKEDVWNQLSQQQGKVIKVDSSITSVTVDGDTLRLPISSSVKKTQAIDVYINISNVLTYGRLADLFVTPTNKTNNPIITWHIKEAGVTDSSISCIGLVEGQNYQDFYARWAVWSQETVGGQSVYGKKNIISSPVIIGQAFPETRVFTEYTLGGLERGKDYLVWIANSNWNQTSRSRSTSGYAWVTFKTW